MAFRARKVSGAFEKRAPALDDVKNLCLTLDLIFLNLYPIPQPSGRSVLSVAYIKPDLPIPRSCSLVQTNTTFFE